MRYILQFMVLLGDIAFATAIVVSLYYAYRSPIVWIVITIAIISWRKTGGFENWRPSMIKQFLKNAKECGL